MRTDMNVENNLLPVVVMLFCVLVMSFVGAFWAIDEIRNYYSDKTLQITLDELRVKGTERPFLVENPYLEEKEYFLRIFNNEEAEYEDTEFIVSTSNGYRFNSKRDIYDRKFISTNKSIVLGSFYFLDDDGYEVFRKIFDSRDDYIIIYNNNIYNNAVDDNTITRNKIYYNDESVYGIQIQETWENYKE